MAKEKELKNNLIKLNPAKTNTVLVIVKWDMNDADYITKTVSFGSEEFFNNKKLLLSLSYACYNGHYIAKELRDLEYSLWDTLDESELEDCLDTCPCFPMLQVLNDNRLVAINENCEPGHSIKEVSVYYVDGTGQAFSIDFSGITDGWTRGWTRESINEFILNN